MKKVKSKAFMITRTAIIYAIFIGGFAFASVLSFTANVPNSFQKENTTAKEDLSLIQTDRGNINTVNENLRIAKFNKDKLAAIEYRKMLLKYKADLKRDKAYLRADKMDLVQYHKLVIKDKREMVVNERNNYCAAKRNLKKNVSAKNGTQILISANQLVSAQSKFMGAKNELAMEKSNLKTDLVALKEQDKHNKSEYAALQRKQTQPEILAYK